MRSSERYLYIKGQPWKLIMSKIIKRIQLFVVAFLFLLTLLCSIRYIFTHKKEGKKDLKCQNRRWWSYIWQEIRKSEKVWSPTFHCEGGRVFWLQWAKGQNDDGSLSQKVAWEIVPESWKVMKNKNSLHNRSVRVTLRPKHKNLINILQRFVWNDDLSISNDSALSLKTG